MFSLSSMVVKSFVISGQVTCLCWSPKGKQLALGALTGEILRVDQNGKLTYRIPASPKHTDLAGMWLLELI